MIFLQICISRVSEGAKYYHNKYKLKLFIYYLKLFILSITFRFLKNTQEQIAKIHSVIKCIFNKNRLLTQILLFFSSFYLLCWGFICSAVSSSLSLGFHFFCFFMLTSFSCSDCVGIDSNKFFYSLEKIRTKPTK